MEDYGYSLEDLIPIIAEPSNNPKYFCQRRLYKWEKNRDR